MRVQIKDLVFAGEMSVIGVTAKGVTQETRELLLTCKSDDKLIRCYLSVDEVKKLAELAED